MLRLGVALRRRDGDVDAAALFPPPAPVAGIAVILAPGAVRWPIPPIDARDLCRRTLVVVGQEDVQLAVRAQVDPAAEAGLITCPTST